jgi:hypothetical protein
MVLTTVISEKELERVAALAYEGETLNVMLCEVAAAGFDASSTVAEWQTTELNDFGYARFTTLIPQGSYDGVELRYQIPAIDAEFGAIAPGYEYDRVVVYIEGSTYVHSVITENPNISLSGGQTQTYRITLICDD